MRWIAREPRRDRIAVGTAWLLVAGVVLFVPPRQLFQGSVATQVFAIAFFGAVVAILIGLAARVFFTRAILEDGILTLYALRPRERLRAPFDAVVGYHMDKAGAWWIHTRPERTSCTDPATKRRVAVREPWELHRAFVELAPKRLGTRRWRFTGIPPTKEFRGLWTFDVERFAHRALPQLAGMLTGVLIGFFLTRRRNLGAVGQPLGLLLIPLIESWGRLDVTDEGVVHRTPFRRKTILWSEAKAIFREGTAARRSFVIVGPECAIDIPTHLASDLELIQKVLYSLPSPILCVNFDETTLRGYRRRKKAKEPARNEDLLPALTA